MPKGRVNRPKLGLEEEEADSGWVWDKYKSSGGGGAPLKSVDGGTVTNLRSVIRGSVDQLAHSSPTRRSGSRTRDYDDDEDSDDGYSNNGDSRRRRRNASNERRNTSSLRSSKHYSDDDEDDDDDYNSRKMSAARSRSRSNDRIDRESHEDKRDRRSRSLSPDPVAVAALMSPKKGLGSALRDMNISQTPLERQAKARKELEYQNALRAQIDEKKRKREEEDRKSEEIKERELEEYLNQYYKGNIPPHVRRSMKKDKKKDLDDDDRRSDGGKRRGNDGYESDTRRRNLSTPDDFDEEEDDRSFRKREKRSPEKSSRNNKSRLIPGLDLDVDSGDLGRPPRSGRRGLDSSRSRGEGWVSQTEYDELSSLCDKLLKQQDDLQRELKSQTKLIKQLQSGKSAARKTLLQLHDDNVSVGSAKNVRARSAIEERRGGGASVGASNLRGRQMPTTTGKERVPRPPSQDKRPSSINAPAQQRDTSRGRPASNGVGFGSRVAKNNLLMKEDPLPRNLSNAGAPKTPRSLGKPSPTKDPRGGNMFRSNSSKYIRDAVKDEEYYVDNNKRGGQNTDQLSGIAKLASMRGGQPIIAVHDDSDHGNGGGIKSALKKSIQTGKSALLKSAELNGNTEFLRIGGEEVDIISGDQLDRLLDKAKKARSSGARLGGPGLYNKVGV